MLSRPSEHTYSRRTVVGEEFEEDNYQFACYLYVDMKQANVILNTLYTIIMVSKHKSRFRKYKQ